MKIHTQASLALITFTALLSVLSIAQDQSSVSHYRSSKYVNGKSMGMEVFEYENQIFSFDTPADWLGQYTESDFLACYQHRQDRNASIVVRKFSTGEFPTNEVAALNIFSNTLQKIQKVNFLKDARSIPLTITNSFAQRYTLSASETTPPTEIHVFFCYAPYIYSCTLTVESRLKGDMRMDFNNVVNSLSIEPKNPPPAVSNTSN